MAQINKPNEYFNTKLYTGDGNSSHAITGVGFQPDWVWIKRRNDVDSHFIYDSVRFDGSNAYWLQTNNTNAEGSDRPLTAFGSDGFTIGSNNSGLNANSSTYVSWNWLASNTTASNTDGSITSTVSANTTAGFSIVSYTGTGSNATVGHGLGAVPRMIIVKRRDGSDSWVVQHGSLGSGKALNLDSTGAVQTYDPYWNATEPTTSVFSIGTDGRTNGSSETYIAYCFAEKQGYSKFGSYTGNGNADGTFVYTGFKPAFVMVKKTSGADAWQMTDHKRDANVSPNFARVLANDTQTEATNTTWARIDKFSNGFKLGGTDSVSNENGSSYIYMAFAEAPLVGSNGVTAKAR